MSFKTGGGSSNFVVITPDDDNDLAAVTEYIHVETDGDLVVHNKNGTEVTFAVLAGSCYPIGARRVLESSTCGQVVGFWAE